MKIRQTFVANSSTCSYVVIGMLLTQKEYQILATTFYQTEHDKEDPEEPDTYNYMLYLEQQGVYVYQGEQDSLNKDEVIIGYAISDGNPDEGGFSGTCTLDEALGHLQILRDQYGVTGTEGIYADTRMC